MPWDTSRRRLTLPSNWRTIRQQVLQRDHHRCTAATHDPRCDRTANEVHHLGNPTDHRLENLASLNTWCHKTETAREAAAARTARPTRTRPPERHPGLT